MAVGWGPHLKQGLNVEFYSRNMLCTSTIIYHLIIVALTVNQLISLYFSIFVASLAHTRFCALVQRFFFCFIPICTLTHCQWHPSSSLHSTHTHTQWLNLWCGFLYGCFIISGESTHNTLFSFLCPAKVQFVDWRCCWILLLLFESAFFFCSHRKVHRIITIAYCYGVAVFANGKKRCELW